MEMISQFKSASDNSIIPIPPVEMRQLVGTTDLAVFDNPTGDNVLPLLGERSYGEIFDFGCGCGRLARKLLQQNPRPKRYVGLDLHAGMIKWCRENLEPCDPNFYFIHSNVYNKGFNPQAEVTCKEFPVESKSFDAIVAHSVFTHLLESTAMFYLQECARILKPGGAFLTTWFLFDKADFPMMQTFQNALYINEEDPTNAVIFDRAWLKMALAEAGLVMTHVSPPVVRGFHWELRLEPVESAGNEAELVEDLAPRGHVPPPVLTVHPYSIGSEDS
jgi:SAM-dependent methyltransferase